MWRPLMINVCNECWGFWGQTEVDSLQQGQGRVRCKHVEFVEKAIHVYHASDLLLSMKTDWNYGLYRRGHLQVKFA